MLAFVKNLFRSLVDFFADYAYSRYKKNLVAEDFSVTTVDGKILILTAYGKLQVVLNFLYVKCLLSVNFSRIVYLVIMKISIEYRAKFKKIKQYVAVYYYNVWLIWYEILSLSVLVFSQIRNRLFRAYCETNMNKPTHRKHTAYHHITKVIQEVKKNTKKQRKYSGKLHISVVLC